MIVITGSYNGQDSLGDECLLKTVVERVQHQHTGTTIHVQLHGTGTSFSQSLQSREKIQVAQGLQSTAWRVQGLLQRLRIPGSMVRSLGPPLAALVGRNAARTLRKANAFFIYGGTQFAGQWYELNAPAYLRSAAIVRDSGGRVFFGPQQFGPLSSENASALRVALSRLVTDWRTRNSLDAPLLEPDESLRAGRVVYDEVFSNVRLYPSLIPSSAPQHILLNLRHTTFDSDDLLGSESYRAITAMMDRIAEAYKLPTIFFAVSDASFSDDDATLAAVKRFSNNPEQYSSIGRINDEYELFELAHSAVCVVSMSFHGCLLSGIAGAPFIPIQEGQYYDYKYADFDKYTGQQNLPAISLSECEPERDAHSIIDYLAGYDADRTFATREHANVLADEFYGQALSELV